MKKAEKSGAVQKTPWVSVVPLVVVAGIVMWMAMFSFWTSNTLFNQDFFVTTVTSALKAEESRQIIARTVVNKVLVDYPIIRTLIGSAVDSMMLNVLETPQVEFIYTKAAEEAFYQMTAPKPREVAVDFSSLSPFLPLIQRVNPQIGNNLAKVPEKIVIVPAGEIPSFYRLKTALGILGPVSAVLSVIVVIVVLVMARGVGDKLKALGLIGLVVGFISGVVYVVIPELEAQVLLQMGNPLVLAVATRIAGTFIANLMELVNYVLIGGFGLGFVGLTVGFVFDKLKKV